MSVKLLVDMNLSVEWVTAARTGKVSSAPMGYSPAAAGFSSRFSLTPYGW